MLDFPYVPIKAEEKVHLKLKLAPTKIEKQLEFLEKQAKDKKIKILNTNNMSVEESVLEVKSEINNF